MHVITRKRLNEFAEKHPDAKSALACWYTIRSPRRRKPSANGAEGSATRLRRGYVVAGIEGKAAREAASECGQRASFNGAEGSAIRQLPDREG